LEVIMPKYCKAYKIQQVREFSGWQDKPKPDGKGLADDDLCFVWENLNLTESCFDETTVLLEASTPGWAEFAREKLAFKVPDDLLAANQPAEAAAT
jgi:hypothetical protein